MKETNKGEKERVTASDIYAMIELILLLTAITIAINIPLYYIIEICKQLEKWGSVILHYLILWLRV